MKLVKELNKSALESEISDKEAEEAFIKILKYIGEDPGREGLLETPKRVRKAFKEYFKGYQEDPYKSRNLIYLPVLRQPHLQKFQFPLALIFYLILMNEASMHFLWVQLL